MKTYKTKEALFGKDGVAYELQKRLYEAALRGKLTDLLGYDKHNRSATDNALNGSYSKTVQGASGQVALEIPRDRSGTFEPQLIRKGQQSFDGFDDKILTMYARGQSVSDIQTQLQYQYVDRKEYQNDITIICAASNLMRQLPVFLVLLSA